MLCHTVKTTHLHCQSYNEARKVIKKLKSFNESAAKACSIEDGGVCSAVITTTDPSAATFLHTYSKAD